MMLLTLWVLDCPNNIHGIFVGRQQSEEMPEYRVPDLLDISAIEEEGESPHEYPHSTSDWWIP